MNFNLFGFGIIDDANETYYVLDELNTTHSNFVLYNRNWIYLTYITMPIIMPFSIISINNELFITGAHGIYKTDKSFNLVETYIRLYAYYSSIYHNSTSDILYVASQGSNRIDLFYRNLSFISSISLTNSPCAITENNGKLYVGLNSGTIPVLENNLFVKTITTLCTATITSIIIDTNELMGVLCFSKSNSMLYLYSTNGSYTGKNMTTASSPRFMSFDLNGHFIIAEYYQIKLYF
jgi:hypothetical protein